MHSPEKINQLAVLPSVDQVEEIRSFITDFSKIHGRYLQPSGPVGPFYCILNYKEEDLPANEYDFPDYSAQTYIAQIIRGSTKAEKVNRMRVLDRYMSSDSEYTDAFRSLYTFEWTDKSVLSAICSVCIYSQSKVTEKIAEESVEIIEVSTEEYETSKRIYRMETPTSYSDEMKKTFGLDENECSKILSKLKAFTFE